MKNIFFTLLTFSAINFGLAQSYSANDIAGFAEWTTIDLDSDGNDWATFDLSGLSNGMEVQGGCMISKSWDGIPLVPDNIAISPEMDFTDAAEIFITFTAGSTRSTASTWYQEHYAVYVVTSEAQLNDLAVGIFPSATFETTLSGGEEMFTENFTLPPAANQDSVHVVIRHFNCTDENYLIIDDFQLTGAPVGIENNTFEVLSVYPNPTNNNLNIKLNQIASSFSIFSLDGKLMKQLTLNSKSLTVDVIDLPSGIYFYEIKTADGKLLREKFIKQ